jgi:pilus assembly protein Flp/PilA
VSYLSLTEAVQSKAAVKPWCKRSSPMKNLFARFAKDESGATAIEYGLIAALIAVFIITAVGMVGGQLDTVFRNIAARLGALPA